MTKLVALKRLKYPRGSSGRDLKPGDEFAALSARDAKALTLVGVAKVAEEKKVVARRTRAPVELPALTTAPGRVVEAKVLDNPTGEAGSIGRRTYLRTDMKAED